MLKCRYLIATHYITNKLNYWQQQEMVGLVFWFQYSSKVVDYKLRLEKFMLRMFDISSV